MLSAVLLMADSGFTVYQHYCAKSDKVQVSYFVDLTHCHGMFSGEESHHGGEGCCSSHAGVDGETHCRGDLFSYHEGDPACCTSEAIFCKLVESYETSSAYQLLSPLYIPVLLAVFTPEKRRLLSEKCQQKMLFDSGPPWGYGIALVRYIQQAKDYL
ncbi:MAG: hypothetical protein CSA95_01780 [Bacteroidetes bacterium]|nr:MAG: hypothetical protein CSA95_01780 [Bacteroidota bacterium]